MGVEGLVRKKKLMVKKESDIAYCVLSNVLGRSIGLRENRTANKADMLTMGLNLSVKDLCFFIDMNEIIRV